MEVPDSGSDDEKVQPVAEVDDLSAESEKYDSAEEGITSVVLVVEGKKLHYTRELLAMASPVIKVMMCKETGLYQEEVEIPGKKFQSVLWMLDYLNPRIRFHMSDEKAVALLSLADEYKMELLKQDCENMLLQVPPRLELVTLALKYNLENLLRHAKQQCVTSLSHRQLEEQRKKPENKNVDLGVYIEVLCKKLDKYASVRAPPPAAATTSVRAPPPAAATTIGELFGSTTTSSSLFGATGQIVHGGGLFGGASQRRNK